MLLVSVWLCLPFTHAFFIHRREPSPQVISLLLLSFAEKDLVASAARLWERFSDVLLEESDEPDTESLFSALLAMYERVGDKERSAALWAQRDNWRERGGERNRRDSSSAGGSEGEEEANVCMMAFCFYNVSPDSSSMMLFLFYLSTPSSYSLLTHD